VQQPSAILHSNRPYTAALRREKEEKITITPPPEDDISSPSENADIYTVERRSVYEQCLATSRVPGVSCSSARKAAPVRSSTSKHMPLTSRKQKVAQSKVQHDYAICRTKSVEAAKGIGPSVNVTSKSHLKNQRALQRPSVTPGNHVRLNGGNVAPGVSQLQSDQELDQDLVAQPLVPKLTGGPLMPVMPKLAGGARDYSACPPSPEDYLSYSSEEDW